MKRILMLLATSFIAANVCSQSLTTMTEYYDYLRTRVKRVYTVLPNDKKHGTEKCYLQTGAHFCTNTWQNGERTAVKVFFTDGSIKVDAKIAPGSTALNGFCSEYSLYAISNKGQRILGMKSKLHKAQSFDNLTNFSHTIMRDRWDIELGDWRVESYQQNYLDGKPRIRFSTSADKKTEHFITYDENGNINRDIVYDILSESLTINTLIIKGQYNIKNGILTMQSQDDRIVNVGDLEYKIPNGTQINIDNKISMSRNDYYGRLTNCVKDEDTGEFVINVSEYGFDLSVDNFLTSGNIGEEHYVFLGRRLKWMPWDYYTCNIDALLAPAEIGNTGDGVYMANASNWQIKATYDGGVLSHIDLTQRDKIIRGEIVDNQLNGEGEYLLGRESYKGQFKNNLKEGNGLLENSQFKYDGEFVKGEIHGKGTKVYINESSSETGEFINGMFNNGIKIIKSKQCTIEYKIVDGETLGGSVIWPNGDRYEGDDIKFFGGDGKLYYNNGDYFLGYITRIMESSLFIRTINAKAAAEHKERFSVYAYEYVRPSVMRFDKGDIRLTLKNGQIYEGDYNKGFNGKGKVIMPDGNEYSGEFTNNQFDISKPIIVKLNLPTGDIFEGMYEMGKFNGPGKLIRNNGEVVEGTFKNGKMIENPKVKLPIKNIIIPTIDFDVTQY